MTILLILVAILAAIALLTWVFLRTKGQPKGRCGAGAGIDWEYFHQPQPNAMLPASLTMLLYQLMQSQQDQHQLDQYQLEVEQFRMLHESTNDLPMFSDSTWDM